MFRNTTHNLMLGEERSRVESREGRNEEFTSVEVFAKIPTIFVSTAKYVERLGRRTNSMSKILSYFLL
jgi:hypothetical protein